MGGIVDVPTALNGDADCVEKDTEWNHNEILNGLLLLFSIIINKYRPQRDHICGSEWLPRKTKSSIWFYRFRFLTLDQSIRGGKRWMGQSIVMREIYTFLKFTTSTASTLHRNGTHTQAFEANCHKIRTCCAVHESSNIRNVVSVWRYLWTYKISVGTYLRLLHGANLCLCNLLGCQKRWTATTETR